MTYSYVVELIGGPCDGEQCLTAMKTCDFVRQLTPAGLWSAYLRMTPTRAEHISTEMTAALAWTAIGQARGLQLKSKRRATT